MPLLEILRKSPFARLLFFYLAGIVFASLMSMQRPYLCLLLTGAPSF
jgi:hypothetical protein